MSKGPDDLAVLEGRLFIASLSHAMVYLLHHASASQPGTGTAVLVSFSGDTFLASALHNFDLENTGDLDAIVRTLGETNFRFCSGDTLHFHNQLTLPRDITLEKGNRLSIATTPLINRDFDLIAVRLTPNEIPADAHPIDLAKYSHTGPVRPGATLTTVGVPLDGALAIESGARVVAPHEFTVQFDPNVAKPSVRTEHKSDQYLLYPYRDHFKNVSARGYSGAPVWSFYELEPQGVWPPKPVIIGIVLKYLPTSKLILAVRIQHLITLLRSDSTLNIP